MRRKTPQGGPAGVGAGDGVPGHPAHLTIEDRHDIARGMAALVAADPRWAAACGDVPLWRVPDGFVCLRDIIVGQVVSMAAAQTVISRLDAAGLGTPDAVLAGGLSPLRAAGLSGAKAGAILAAAGAGIDWTGLRRLPDAAVIDTLTALPGVGAWTADVYLMTGLGRADAFPAGDMALAEGARQVFSLPSRPSPAALNAMSQAWRPWRGVAGRALWALYLRERGRLPRAI